MQPMPRALKVLTWVSAGLFAVALLMTLLDRKSVV